MNNHLIYKHTIPSGKSYIGQTNNYVNRCNWHKSQKGCRLFANAIKRYGWDNFIHEILISGLTLEQANKYEEFYISEHNSLAPNGYNLISGGLNNRHSDETKVKISKSIKGRVPWNKNVPRTDEYKQRMSVKHKQTFVDNPDLKRERSVQTKKLHSEGVLNVRGQNNPMFGRKRKGVFNPTTNESKFIDITMDTNELQQILELGWQLGIKRKLPP